MSTIDAITLVIAFAIGVPSWAAILWLVWHFARTAIVVRKARRAILEANELVCRVHCDDLINDVRIPPEVKV